MVTPQHRGTAVACVAGAVGVIVEKKSQRSKIVLNGELEQDSGTDDGRTTHYTVQLHQSFYMLGGVVWML